MLDIEPTEYVHKYLNRHSGYELEPMMLEERWQRQIQRAVKRVEQVQQLIEQYKPKSMLDVGCGLGVIDIVLARQHKLERIHLLDGDGIKSIHHGYQADMQPWNNVYEAAKLVASNLVVKNHKHMSDVVVTPHQVGKSFEIAPPVDMVCSFKSWGVHYPVETYLIEVQSWLRFGGLLLIDIMEERGKGDKNSIVMDAGFGLVHQFDWRLRAFERM